MKSLQEFKLMPILIAASIAVLVPLAGMFLLNTQASLLAVYIVIFLKLGLTFISIFHSRHVVRRICGISSSLVLLIFGLLIIAGIVMTPLSTFKIWFAAFFQGDHGGIISNLFFLIISFFSALFSSLVIKKSSLSVLTGLVAVLLGTLTLITQDMVFGIMFSISLVMFIFIYIRSGIIFSVIIIIFCFLVGLLFWGQSPEPKGNEFVSKTLHGELRRLVNRTIPTFPLAIGIPGYGYTMGMDETIGERPLLSPIPIFGINGTVNNYEYLATEHLDTFSGSQWHVASEQEHLFNSKLPNQFSLPQDATRGFTIDVFVDSYLYLPHTPEASYAMINNVPASIELKLGERGIFCNPPLRAGDVITLFSKPSSLKTRLEYRERYLTIPRNVSPQMRELAAQLNNDLNDPVQTAAIIQLFLGSEYKYSLEAPAAPADTPVLDHFLFTSHTGFCEHFATAYVLLSRLSGIPSRYVRGFLIVPPDESEVIQDYTVVTGLSAHAWAEIWIYGKGWVTAEATPPFIGESTITGNLISSDPYTSSQLEALRRIRKPGGSPSFWTKFSFLNNMPTAVIGSVILACLLLLLCFFLFRHFYRRMLKRHRASELLKCYIKAGSKVALPMETTWSGWIAKISENTSGIKNSLDSLSSVILRVAYSDLQPSRRDLKYLHLFLPRLRQSLRKYRYPGHS